MKSLIQHLNEKLLINKDTKIFDLTKISNDDEFTDLISERFEPTSKVLDLSSLDFSSWNCTCALTLKYIRDELNNSSVETIDVSNWTFGDAHIDFSFMFRGCKKIKHIIGIDEWDCKYAEHADSMFSGCECLEGKIDLSRMRFHLNNVVLCKMFAHCKNLREIILPDTEINTDELEFMFGWCDKLIVIKNLDKLKVSKLQGKGIFCQCPELRIIRGIDDWDVSDARDLSYLFMDSKNVVLFDSFFNNWKVNERTNTEQMFTGTRYFNKKLDTI